MGYRIIVSYAREDREDAVILCNHLLEEGLEASIAPRAKALDQRFASEISTLISESNVLLVLMSNFSTSSGQMLRELELASKHHLTILPVRLDHTKPAGSIGYYLSGKRWFDMLREGGDPWDTAVKISQYLRQGDQSGEPKIQEKKGFFDRFRSKRK